MIVIGTDVVERYFAARSGHRGIKAARAQYDAWRAIAEKAQWKRPEDVKKAHPKASMLKGARVEKLQTASLKFWLNGAVTSNIV